MPEPQCRKDSLKNLAFAGLLALHAISCAPQEQAEAPQEQAEAPQEQAEAPQAVDKNEPAKELAAVCYGEGNPNALTYGLATDHRIAIFGQPPSSDGFRFWDSWSRERFWGSSRFQYSFQHDLVICIEESGFEVIEECEYSPLQDNEGKLIREPGPGTHKLRLRKLRGHFRLLVAASGEELLSGQLTALPMHRGKPMTQCPSLWMFDKSSANLDGRITAVSPLGQVRDFLGE